MIDEGEVVMNEQAIAALHAYVYTANKNDDADKFPVTRNGKKMKSVLTSSTRILRLVCFAGNEVPGL